jgi:endoglycosylceramidase
LVFVPAATGLPNKPLAAEGLQWLHVMGSSIVRDDGATMILRGTNLRPLDSPYAAVDRYALYLDTAKSMGFNAVRLPISWAELEPTPGRYSARYLNLVRKIVNLAEDRRIYIVLDMHQFRMSGFPSWILAKHRTADEAAFHFWSDLPLQTELVNAWKMLSSSFKDEKAVLGYDLLNEPYGGPIPWQEFAPTLNDFYSRLILGIRSIDTRHAILFEPVEGVSLLGEHIALKPQGSGLVFSPHAYISGSAQHLEYAVSRLYNLTVNVWNIPLWIGEFGGAIVQIKDEESLNSLTVMLDLFDRYKLGWAYWILGETTGGPRVVDSEGHTSPLLTSMVTRIFPAYYTTRDTAFSYNSTPRFQLIAYAESAGTIHVSVPRVFSSMIIRCIDCTSVRNNETLSVRIQLIGNTTGFFYMDITQVLARLETRAESEFEQALQILDEFGKIDIRSPRSRVFLKEIDDLVASMRASLSKEHYEFTLNELHTITKLRALVVEEEETYTRTAEYVDSVKQEIMVSQGRLSEYQSSLLSQAYRSLAQGNYSSATEWANRARDAPSELPREEADPAFCGMLGRASLALLAIALLFVLLRALKR